MGTVSIQVTHNTTESASQEFISAPIVDRVGRLCTRRCQGLDRVHEVVRDR